MSLFVHSLSIIIEDPLFLLVSHRSAAIPGKGRAIICSIYAVSTPYIATLEGQMEQRGVTSSPISLR